MLTRREGEAVLIGEDIEVRVASIKGDKVRLSFLAPLSQRVDREEVRRAIEAEAAEAAQGRVPCPCRALAIQIVSHQPPEVGLSHRCSAVRHRRISGLAS